jgi:predicted nucleic acid-binding protein
VRGIAVDTSVWIDFFAGKTVAPLEEALAAQTVVLAPLVVAELVSAAVRPRERQAIIELVRDLPVHETPRSHWVSVGELRRELRHWGLTVSTPDAHIAQCALDRRAPLLSRDSVFGRIAELTPLRLVGLDA